MTIFELVKIALDELYQEGLAEHGEDLDAVVKERMTVFIVASILAV